MKPPLLQKTAHQFQRLRVPGKDPVMSIHLRDVPVTIEDDLPRSNHSVACRLDNPQLKGLFGKRIAEPIDVAVRGIRKLLQRRRQPIQIRRQMTCHE